MRILAIALILSLAACSVARNTERNSGVGFDYYPVPSVSGEMG